MGYSFIFPILRFGLKISSFIISYTNTNVNTLYKSEEKIWNHTVFLTKI